MKRILSVILILVMACFACTALAAQDAAGWRYAYRDMAGSNYYPYPSTVQTDNTLVEQFSISGTSGSVLTGDVTGDGYLEIIHASGNQLNIYDYTGKLLKNVALGSSKCYVDMIEDINGDGILDIGIGSTSTSSLKVYFYDGQGNLLKTFSKTGGYDAGMRPWGILSDGNIIINFHCGYGWSSGYRGYGVFDNNNDSQKWYYSVGPCHGISSIADFDNDGRLEFANSAYSCHNGCYGDGYNHNGTRTTDGDMWLLVVDEQGNEEFSVKYPSPSDGHAQHFFVDLNNDGKMEILGMEGHDPTYYKGTSQVHLYDQNGSVTKSFDGTSNAGWTQAIADINNDGKDEIVACASISGGSTTLYVLDYGLNLLNSKQLSGYVRTKLISDINGDGKKEIVLLADQGELSVLDSNLTVLATFNVTKGGSVVASDLDKNGIVDLICLTDKIYVLETTGTGGPENGGKIVLSKKESSGNYDLWLMDSDGGNLQRLTDEAKNGTICIDPQFFPNANKVVFRKGGNIFVLDISTMSQQAITTDGVASGDYGYGLPKITPDEKKIVYQYGLHVVGSCAPCQTYEIWIMDIDGSNKTQLTDNCYFDRHVIVSPNGDKLLISHYENAPSCDCCNAPDVFLYDLNTGKEELFYGRSGKYDIATDWSSVGVLLDFSTYGSSSENDIALIKENGTGLTIIKGEGDDNSYSYPMFSPDNSKVMYISTKNGNSDLYVSNLDGTGEKQITSGFAVQSFDWKASGASGACTETDTGALDVAAGSGTPGGTVSIPVRIQSAPNAVSALGFELTFPASLLTYTDYTKGSLVDDWTFFESTNPESGVVRVGGFTSTTGIVSGQSGYVVYLNFAVSDSWQGPTEIALQNLKDDIAGWSSSSGCVGDGATCDINGDSEITPQDALCAFQKYMGICPTACGDCANVGCDVNQDGDCTPADALEIFKEYMGIRPNACSP